MTDPDTVAETVTETTLDEAGDLVTVFVPARDESGFIGACLGSVRAQDHRNMQIVVVVDGGSRDDTAEQVAAMAAEDPRIELLRNDRGGIPVSLNMAVAAARGRWLVRVDAHSTVPADYVSTAVALLREGSGAVSAAARTDVA
ncbi:glycosyltransferase [Pseudonocardia benzenivorans]